MRRSPSLPLLAAALCLAPCARAQEVPRQIEAEARLCGHASHGGGVLDGDSLDVEIVRAVAAAEIAQLRCSACRAVQVRDRDVHGHTQLRLGGGIDAPEAREPGGREARSFLTSLLRDAGTLYLDIDGGTRGCPRHAHSGRDAHCRLLALVWVRRGEGWLNVNQALLDWGRVHVPDHDWLRYASQPSEFSAALRVGADEPLVWIGRSGTRYHRQGCATLRHEGQPVPRSVALGRGLSGCRRCLPP